MGDSSTAMRDPVFYRWHAYINDIFQEFKATFPGYTTQYVRKSEPINSEYFLYKIKFFFLHFSYPLITSK